MPAYDDIVNPSARIQDLARRRPPASAPPRPPAVNLVNIVSIINVVEMPPNNRGPGYQRVQPIRKTAQAAKPKADRKSKKKGQSAVDSQQSFIDEFVSEHTDRIDPAYDKHEDLRDKIVKQLEGVKVVQKEGKWEVDKRSGQNPYNNMRKRLVGGKPVDPALAEAVRVMSEDHVYSEKMVGLIISASWDPEKIFMPLKNDADRKIKDSATLDKLKKKYKVTAEPPSLGAGDGGGVDDSDSDVDSDGDPKEDDGTSNGDLLNAIEGSRSDIQGLKESVVELKESVDELKESVEQNAVNLDEAYKNIEVLFGAVNNIGDVCDGMNKTLQQLAGAGAVAQGVGMAVATPAANDGNHNNQLAPAPAPNGAVDRPVPRGHEFTPLGQPHVDPQTGRTVVSYMDPNNVILQAAAGGGQNIVQKLDGLTATVDSMHLPQKLTEIIAAIDSLHLSGEHDRLKGLIDTTGELEGTVTRHFADNMTRLIKLQSTVDSLRPTAGCQDQKNQPMQPVAASAAPGGVGTGGQQPRLFQPQPLAMVHDIFRQSTPGLNPRGHINENNNTASDGGGGPQQQHQYPSQSTPAPSTAYSSPFGRQPQQQPTGGPTQGSQQSFLPFPQVGTQSNSSYGLPNSLPAFASHPWTPHQQPQQQPQPQPQQPYQQQQPVTWQGNQLYGSTPQQPPHFGGHHPSS